VGFEVSTTGSVLTFPEDSKLAGLEVTVDEAPMGLLLDIMEDYAVLSSGALDIKAAARVLKSLTENFAAVLESWNATRKGKPVPATLEGLRSLGQGFVMPVIGAWLTGRTQADEDLGKGSPNGGTSPEALEAMAALSTSLPSSSPQRLLSGCATAGTACRLRFWRSLRGCCGCSTCTGWDTATRKRRGVSNRRWRTTTSLSRSRLTTALSLTWTR
jgi:hypothetical protein